MELTTTVKYGMNITHVLLTNHELGSIGKAQHAGRWEVWDTSLVHPDFAACATLCGALGIRVTERGRLDAVLERALTHRGPALVEILPDPGLVGPLLLSRAGRPGKPKPPDGRRATSPRLTGIRRETGSDGRGDGPLRDARG